MSQKKNGKDDALLAFMQNGKFFFQNVVSNFSPQNVSCVGTGTIPRFQDPLQVHGQRLQISTLCMENKMFVITSSLQNIRSFNPFSTGKIEKLDFCDSNNSTNFKHQ